MMNIGIDVKSLSKRYTGIAVYIYDLIRYFNELDNVDEFFLYSHKPFELDFKLNKNFHKRIYKGITGSIGVMFQLSKRLRNDNIDLFWGPEHCLVWGKQKFKQVVTIHDLAVLHNPNVGTRYNALLQRFMTIPSCRNADKIIAISQSTANDVIQTSGVDKNKIQIIYNGDSPYIEKNKTYTVEEQKEIENKFSIKKGCFFLFVGSIEPRKNIETIIDAYSMYRKSGDFKLVLAGGLGWRYRKIINKIQESPYKSDIILTGYCSSEEKEFLYRNTASLVFPSLWEGFGFPIVEAMSVGAPVITARVSSLPEVGGDCAFYIDNPLDYIGLSKLMIQIQNLDDDQRELLSKKNKSQAALFSRRFCAKETLDLFHKCYSKL